MNQDITKYSEHIRTMARGSIDDEISEALSELVRECRIHGQPGTLTVTLRLKPEGRDGDYMAIDCTKIAVNAPQPKRLGAVMYARSNGDLLRDDPEQVKMQLRSVGGETVDPTTGEIING